MKLWDWFRGVGQANGRPVDDDEEGALSASRKPGPRPLKATMDRVERKWDKDGNRSDQDYYHIPGAGNPDAADPPKLHGEELPEPRAPRGRHAARAKKTRRPAPRVASGSA
jgi:hypothetical protein